LVDMAASSYTRLKTTIRPESPAAPPRLPGPATTSKWFRAHRWPRPDAYPQRGWPLFISLDNSLL